MLWRGWHDSAPKVTLQVCDPTPSDHTRWRWLHALDRVKAGTLRVSSINTVYVYTNLSQESSCGRQDGTNLPLQTCSAQVGAPHNSRPVGLYHEYPDWNLQALVATTMDEPHFPTDLEVQQILAGLYHEYPNKQEFARSFLQLQPIPWKLQIRHMD